MCHDRRDDGASVEARRRALGEQRLLFFTHDEISGLAREPARIMINFRVDDADAAAAHLEGLGVLDACVATTARRTVG